jgi:hypothetical protein
MTQKEVLYLRHKLQRGLLTGEQTPKADDMPQMSDYITMLENFSGLEVSIIRATKINKVLKAILKLDSVPREEEFEFKSRSQKLLEKWNKLMAGETAPAATNGVNGTTESHKGEKDGKKKTDEETPAKETSPKETLEPAEKSVELEAKKPEEVRHIGINACMGC